MSRVDELTLILNELGARPDGDSAALIELVYDELRALSEAYLREERPDHRPRRGRGARRRPAR